MIHEDEETYISRRGKVTFKQPKEQCPFVFRKNQCGLVEGHKGAHVGQQAAGLCPDRSIKDDEA